MHDQKARYISTDERVALNNRCTVDEIPKDNTTSDLHMIPHMVAICFVCDTSVSDEDTLYSKHFKLTFFKNNIVKGNGGTEAGNKQLSALTAYNGKTLIHLPRQS